MAKRIGLAEAKAKFSALVDDVLHHAEHYLIERRGKPVAALVSVDELHRLEVSQPAAGRPAGALALVGAWHDVDDAEIDTLIADIRAERERDIGRPVGLEA